MLTRSVLYRAVSLSHSRVCNILQTQLPESDITLGTISTSTQNASIWSLTAAAPSDSVFPCAICINWLTYLLTVYVCLSACLSLSVQCVGTPLITHKAHDSFVTYLTCDQLVSSELSNHRHIERCLALTLALADGN